MSAPPLWLLVAAFALAIVREGSEQSREDDAADVCRQLQAFLDGKLPPQKLEITYAGMHGLSGGMTMTVRGTGKVEQESVRQKLPQPKPLDAAGVRQTVKLLIEKEAWRQKSALGRLLPGETTVSLTIVAGDAKSIIRERARDMKANDQILPVLVLMEKLAWPDANAE